MLERRLRRSSEPREALALFLRASRERLGVHALAVSTTTGSLVAGSGDGAILLAALGHPSLRASLPQVSIAKLDADHLLTTLGAAKALDDVATGARRILEG